MDARKISLLDITTVALLNLTLHGVYLCSGRENTEYNRICIYMIMDCVALATQGDNTLGSIVCVLVCQSSPSITICTEGPK